MGAAAVAVEFHHIGQILLVAAGEITVDVVLPGFGAEAAFQAFVLVEVLVLEVVLVAEGGLLHGTGNLLHVEDGVQDAVLNLREDLRLGSLHGIFDGHGLQEGVRLPFAEGRRLLVGVGGGPEVAAGREKKGRRKG